MKGSDVHLISEASTDKTWNGDCVLYRHEDGELVVLPYDAALPVSLKVLEHGIFTVSPIKVLAPGYRFAPLGLVDMYNAGGAIEGLSYQVHSAAESLELDSSIASKLNEVSLQSLNNTFGDFVATVCMEVKGCGKFGAYSSTKPKNCMLNSVDIEFCYEPTSGRLTLQLESMPKADQKLHQVSVQL